MSYPPANDVAVAAVRHWIHSVDLDDVASGHRAKVVALAYVCDLIAPPAANETPTVRVVLDRMPLPVLTEGSLLDGLLASAAILRRDQSPGHAGLATAYVTMIDSALGDASPWAVGMANLALHGSAIVPDSAAQSGREAAEEIRWRAQSAGGASIGTFLCMIELATRFGTRHAHVDPVLPKLLEGAAMSALRSHRLCHGMRCMRALRYLGVHDGPPLHMGMAFVNANFDAGGSFNDYYASMLQHSGQSNQALTLQLPALFDSLWTIAESDASVRLMSRAFGPGGLLAMQAKAQTI